MLVGLLLLVTGAIMLLDEQRFFHIGNAWRLWPVFMMVIGINGLIRARRRSIFSGLLMVGMGFLFLGINFGVAGLRMRYFAPIVVLITGISFMVDALVGRRGGGNEDLPPGGQP